MKTKIFKLYWLGGKTEIITGKNLIQAFRRFGYSKTALQALVSFEIL